MTLRSYLRFFRPIRTLLVIGLYTVLTSFWGRAVFRLDASTCALVSVGFALPLMLGLAIAGATHEPLHRPFALLLPDVLGSIRRFAKWSAVASVVVSSLLTAWFVPHFPALAIVGFTAACTALPCLDRHRSFGGVGGLGLAVIAWLFATWLLGRDLFALLSAAPAVIFVAGVGIAAVSLVLGYARWGLRGRAETPAVALQTAAFSSLFQPAILSRRVEEYAAFQIRQKKRLRGGRDWTVKSVGSNTLAWMHVVWHAYAGRTSFGYWRTQLSLPIVQLVYLLLLPLLTRMFQRSGAEPQDGADYWTTLASMTAPNLMDGRISAGVPHVGSLMHPCFAAFALMLIAQPQLPYPISRTRLARTVFGLSIAQIAYALLVPALLAFGCSAAGQFFSGHHQPFLGARFVAENTAALLVILPLLAASGSYHRPLWRVVWAAIWTTTLVVVLVGRTSWAPHLFTGLGTLVCIVSSSAALAVLWWRLHRRYCHTDLTFAANLSNARIA